MSPLLCSLIVPLHAALASPVGAVPLVPQSTSETTAIDQLHHSAGTMTGPAGIAHVERRGRGPVPLVLIAGAPFGWRVWESFMARNEALYTMFAVTPAGYDGTPPPAMPEKEHEDYAERVWTKAVLADLVTMIEKEIVAPGKLGAPVVVGHHLMSDYYAFRLAREHPELVRALISAAGMGSVPVGQGTADAQTRERFVRDNRAPFFRTVSQETWNANTFSASSLSKDAERGKLLYKAQVAVPIATQVRYYLEYMTDEIESHMEFIQAPILALRVDPPAWTFDNLSKPMKDQLVQKFGSLEEARKQVQFGGPLDLLMKKAKPGQMRRQDIPSSGIFLMDDNSEAFDRELASFVGTLPAEPPAVPGSVKQH